MSKSIFDTNSNKVLFTSDLHFYHTNIIKYADRPFEFSKSGTLAMNSSIIAKFKSLPDKPTTVVVNNGDIFYGQLLQGKAAIDLMREVISEIKGNKTFVLILGNHDFDMYRLLNADKEFNNIEDFFRSLGFDYVYSNPVCVDNKYILSHEPVFLSKNSNMYNIYGHTHQFDIDDKYFKVNIENYKIVTKAYVDSGRQDELPKLVETWPTKEIDVSHYINVCYDANNYDFVKFNDIKKKTKD